MSVVWIPADWPAPPQVRAGVTGRGGGVSAAAWRALNLATHVGDDPQAVAENRRRLRTSLSLPTEPAWLQQVHGCRVVDLDSNANSHWDSTGTASVAGGPGVQATAHSPADTAQVSAQAQGFRDTPPEADGAYTRTAGRVCAVLTADCLPVVLCDRAGTRVATVHAGWRGLSQGVLEAAVTALDCPAENLLAWLGPAIGPAHFEVGGEVRAAFLAIDPGAREAFAANSRGRWQADLYALARRRLNMAGVAGVYGGGACAFAEADRFFSYRRDGVCGRMATLAWLA